MTIQRQLTFPELHFISVVTCTYTRVRRYTTRLTYIYIHVSISMKKYQNMQNTKIHLYKKI